MIKTPNWIELFTEIVDRGQESLEWGLPEGWCHAELYRELKTRMKESGWIPIPDETPYATCYPVKATTQNTAIKWVDLCLHTEGGDAWCWFELKARKKVDASLLDKRTLQGRDALRKDVAALVGFDAQETAQRWQNTNSASNYYSPHVKDFSQALLTGQHYFTAAFLQIGGGPDGRSWDHEVFSRELAKWLEHRQKGSLRSSQPNLTIENVTHASIRAHSLVLYEWHIEPAQ
jgi:hypothetical protein